MTATPTPTTTPAHLAHSSTAAQASQPPAPANPPSPDTQATVQVGWGDMQAAVQRGVLAPNQAHALWADWAAPGSPLRVGGQASGTGAVEAKGQEPDQLRGQQRGQMQDPIQGHSGAVTEAARFSFAHVLYYFGGMLAIGAMSLFMTYGWALLGPWGSALLGTAYFYGAWRVARHFGSRGLPVPAGNLATLAICLVPLVVWSVQKGLGLWPEGGSTEFVHYHQQINWRWLTLELATLAAAVVMLRQFRYPFMVMPVAVTLWYLSLDLCHMLMQPNGFDWQFTRDFSLVSGLFVCALAVWVDLRCRLATDPQDRQDFAFWLYLFGALMFWAGLSLRDSESELNKAMYCFINVVLVFWGAAINRRVFTVLGGMGVAIYLSYLAGKVFQDSLAFTFVLTLLGLSVVALGVWWQRNEVRIHARLAGWLPVALRPLADSR